MAEHAGRIEGCTVGMGPDGMLAATPVVDSDTTGPARPRALWVLSAMARVPREGSGYLADLMSPALAPEVEEDRLRQVARWVPDLVAAWPRNPVVR